MALADRKPKSADWEFAAVMTCTLWGMATLPLAVIWLAAQVFVWLLLHVSIRVTP